MKPTRILEKAKKDSPQKSANHLFTNKKNNIMTTKQLENFAQLLDMSAKQLGFTTTQEIEANFETIARNTQTMVESTLNKVLNTRK